MLICPLSPETLLELTDLQHQSIRFADMTTLPLDVEKEQSAQSLDTKDISATEPEKDHQSMKNSEKAITEDIGPDDDGYPQGLRLFCVVVALGMSIFLVALDMVRLTSPNGKLIL